MTGTRNLQPPAPGQPAPGDLAALETQQRIEAQKLFDELLALAPEARLAEARKERFKHLGLAEVLVEASRGAQPRELDRSRHCARLALTVARHFGVNRRADAVKVQALCLDANALRLKKDHEGAESLFRSAAFQLTSSPAAWERGVYCRLLAELRREQDRIDEAAALLERAIQIFREADDRAGESEALGALGEVFLAADDLARALGPLTRAWVLLDPRHDPAQAVTVGLSLALCEAARGNAAAAHALAGTARALAAGVADPRAELTWPWLEARIALATEAFERAAALLEPVRKTFFDRKQLHPAALATLDLGHALARAGRGAEVHALMHDVGAAFALSAEREGSLGALSLFVAAVEIGVEDLAAVAGEARALLRRFHHNPVNAAHDLAVLAGRERQRQEA